MNPATRLEELLQGCLNSTLDEAQEQELARLLQESTEARQALRSSLRVEGGLLNLARAGQLSGSTPHTLEERAEGSPPALPSPVRPSAGRVILRRVAIGAAVLAASVLIAIVGVRWLTPGPVPVPSPTVLAHVIEMDGTVEIVTSAGETHSAEVSGPLVAGDTVQTGEGNSLAVIEFADGRRLKLSPGTTIRLAEEGTGTVQLLQGVARGNEAEHSRKPLLITTVGLSVRIEGDRFVLSSASPESLRVDVEAGKAEVVRQRDQKSLTVESGETVLVNADLEDMAVASMPRFMSEPKRVLDFPGAWAVYFEPDGQHLLAASYREVRRYGAGPRPKTTLLSTDTSHGRLAAFSNDSRTLAVYRGVSKDDPVILWDLRDRQQRARIDARITDRRFALAPDGSWLATVDKEETPSAVRVWDGQTGSKRFSVSAAPRIFCLAASPDSTLLAVGVVDLGRREPNRVLLVNARTGKEAASLPTRAQPLTALAFSPDGRYLAAGITGLVQVWDVEKRRLVRTIRGFERVLMTLAWSPDGKLLAGGTQDGQVWVWDANRGEEVQVIRAGTSGVRLLAFSPDGRTLATGGIKRHPLMLWEVTPPPERPPARHPPAKT